MLYMKQPECFVQKGQENMMCLMKKSLYRLKQSLRQWYKQSNSFIIKVNYTRCEYDSCVYSKQCNGDLTYLLLYVDDMLIAVRK